MTNEYEIDKSYYYHLSIGALAYIPLLIGLGNGFRPYLDKYSTLRVSSYKNNLISEEDGLYFLGQIDDKDFYWDTTNTGKQIQKVQDNIEKFFSRA